MKLRKRRVGPLPQYEGLQNQLDRLKYKVLQIEWDRDKGVFHLYEKDRSRDIFSLLQSLDYLNENHFTTQIIDKIY